MSGLSQLINNGRGKLARFVRAAADIASCVRGDRRGNVLTIFAISLPLMIGGLGLGVEGANWYQTKRALQNAADEAVVAAATNNTSTYQSEARAVAAKYGFTNGSSNVTVNASNAATCPDGTTSCYSVTITKKLQLLFLPIFGFSGNTTIGTAGAQLISSTAVASFQTTPRNYCVLALAYSAANADAVAFLSNGGPKADLSGCSIMSNASMTCHGHDLEADYGDAAGTNNGCGNVQDSNMAALVDPYASLASSIPDPGTTCSGGYPQEPTLPASNLLGGVQTSAINKTFCGDVKLTSNVTLTGDNVIVIRNGKLDTNGFSLTTGTGTATATIIFSGTNGTYSHTLAGSGTVTINSPSTGTWKGVAVYTDPSLTSGVNMSAAGNSPSWNMSGLAYFPHATITWSGIVGKATNGHSCFVLVVDTITFNGTAAMLDRGECDQQGLTMPNTQIANRGRLVA
jgi:Flp pilus assembly protein TadG